MNIIKSDLNFWGPILKTHPSIKKRWLLKYCHKSFITTKAIIAPTTSLINSLVSKEGVDIKNQKLNFQVNYN